MLKVDELGGGVASWAGNHRSFSTTIQSWVGRCLSPLVGGDKYVSAFRSPYILPPCPSLSSSLPTE